MIVEFLTGLNVYTPFANLQIMKIGATKGGPGKSSVFFVIILTRFRRHFFGHTLNLRKTIRHTEIDKVFGKYKSYFWFSFLLYWDQSLAILGTQRLMKYSFELHSGSQYGCTATLKNSCLLNEKKGGMLKKIFSLHLTHSQLQAQTKRLDLLNQLWVFY